MRARSGPRSAALFRLALLPPILANSKQNPCQNEGEKKCCYFHRKDIGNEVVQPVFDFDHRGIRQYRRIVCFDILLGKYGFAHVRIILPLRREHEPRVAISFKIHYQYMSSFFPATDGLSTHKLI